MFSPQDREIIRGFAKQVAEIASLPIQEERRDLWKKHNSLGRVRPLILVFPEGSWQELLPKDALQCVGDVARGIEWELRSKIYAHEHFASDNVVEGFWEVHKDVGNTGWGIAAKHHDSSEERGAWAFEPVINQPSDLAKLKYPEVTYDDEATMKRLSGYQDLFGDILNIRLRGIAHISFHLMNLYTRLRGLEQVMVDMYEEPKMLHDAMAFFEEGHRRLLQQYVDLNLLDVNNDNTYHNSGGNGYTDELPKSDYDADRVRLCDMWGSAEAQEMAQVSPDKHVEFSMQYEKRLLEPFGLTGYGCCEDLTRKLEDVFTIPNIRRISISPWSDVDVCADKLNGNYIFSWKPNPAHLVGEFNHAHIKDYIKHTVDAAGGGVLEIILKDTHTCENHPERFDEWTRIAWELANG